MKGSLMRAAFTGPGDSLGKIIYDNYGANCSNHEIRQRASEILAINSDSSDIMNPFYNWPNLQNHPEIIDYVVHPHMVFWMPEIDPNTGRPIPCHGSNYDPNMAEAINRDRMSRRQAVHQLVESGQDYHQTAAAIKVGKALNSAGGAVMFGADVVVSGVEKTGDYLFETAQAIITQLARLNGLFKRFAATAGKERGAIQSQIIQEHRVLQQELNKAIANVSSMSARGIATLKSRRKLYRMARRTGRDFDLLSTEEAKLLLKTSVKFALVTGVAVFTEVYLGFRDVREAYEKHGDWMRKLFEEGDGMAMGQLFGTVFTFGVEIAEATLLLTPAGWVIVAGGVIISSVGWLIGKASIDWVLGSSSSKLPEA